MSITIKLDTNALADLLKDDATGEVKLELQQAIVNEFAKKHLKGSVVSDAVRAAEDRIMKIQSNIIADMMEQKRGTYTYTASAKLTAIINSKVNDAIGVIVSAKLDQLSDVINSVVERRLAAITDSIIRTRLAESVNSVVGSTDIGALINEKVRASLAGC